MDWRRFYDSYPKQFAADDYLRQAGHTIGGAPISAAQFDLILARMVELLNLQPDDTVLDLCCGNGVFTHRLSRHSSRIVGVDFSTPLIEVARRAHDASNITYVLDDVKNLNASSLGARFDKVVMCGALQHFDRRDLDPLLRNLADLTEPDATIAFMLVPDRARRWNFYDSPASRLAHLARRVRRRERMGTWWSRAWIVDACAHLDLEAEFFDLDESLHPSRYRFDVRIRPR